MPETGPAGDAFAKLGWADLEAWAGRRIVPRGKRYHQDGCVSDIGRTAAGGLVAWDSGSRQDFQSLKEAITTATAGAIG